MMPRELPTRRPAVDTPSVMHVPNHRCSMEISSGETVVDNCSRREKHPLAKLAPCQETRGVVLATAWGRDGRVYCSLRESFGDAVIVLSSERPFFRGSIEVDPAWWLYRLATVPHDDDAPLGLECRCNEGHNSVPLLPFKESELLA